MVSFHQVLAEHPITEVVSAELEASISKKRKWEEPLITEEFFKDHSTTTESNPEKKNKPIFDIELHLETPLPSNKLQKYLSIQSSGIHLFNTRMNVKKPISKISPELLEPRSPHGQMSLDLELNLTCESLNKKEEYSCDINENNNKSSCAGSPAVSLCERDLFTINESSNNKKKKEDSSSSGLTTRSPSWLSIEGGDDHKEMVATVCMRCHMLVMLCKSSPSCPNCKFMHPPDQNPSFLMKRRRCSLLCVD